MKDENRFMDITKICAFTGYRPGKMPCGGDESADAVIVIKKKLYDIVEKLAADGIKIFMSGMAMGFDLFAAEAVISVKKKYDVKLIAVIPYHEQSEKWNAFWRTRYDDTLKQCDGALNICKEYTYSSYKQRNKYLVDNAATVVTYFDGKAGGTMSTVIYAESLDRKVINIADPDCGRV